MTNVLFSLFVSLLVSSLVLAVPYRPSDVVMVFPLIGLNQLLQKRVSLPELGLKEKLK